MVDQGKKESREPNSCSLTGLAALAGEFFAHAQVDMEQEIRQDQNGL
jgi:hypothetical protein